MAMPPWVTTSCPVARPNADRGLWKNEIDSRLAFDAAPHMQEPPLRIAMWSGPRNISTALMRSFGPRPDTAVVDEPFYGAYLTHTGLVHPMREAVIASQPSDWRDVVKGLLGPVPAGKPVCYQKHM